MKKKYQDNQGKVPGLFNLHCDPSRVSLVLSLAGAGGGFLPAQEGGAGELLSPNPEKLKGSAPSFSSPQQQSEGPSCPRGTALTQAGSGDRPFLLPTPGPGAWHT